MTEKQEVELRGILETISGRFWSGWGFGTLATDAGPVKITGALEGHVVGTSLIVRGYYKESPYGQQLECASIVVDSVSGDLSVIRSWARKDCKDHEHEIVLVVKCVAAADRWALLCDKKELAAAGMEAEVAAKVAAYAENYLRVIETKKGLMERGFTDREADAMCERYGDRVMETLEEDPYGIVIDRIVPFTRIDVVAGESTPRNDERRLQAALVQALAGSLRNGHTAMAPRGAQKEAAEIAGVYVNAIEAVDLPSRQVVKFGDKLQLRQSAYNEQDIATWVVEALKLEV